VRPSKFARMPDRDVALDLELAVARLYVAGSEPLA